MNQCLKQISKLRVPQLTLLSTPLHCTGFSKLRVPQLTWRTKLAHIKVFSKLRVPQLTKSLVEYTFY
ncbi:hypothetical protein GLIP_3210 [Aliiglaciecola lipolytica E3]|uniref:Uncharacterized protein n=1 Tax=Aliiglaciecola lipolytica E3 TaxID=1127673 RepID=K6YCC5_9ALTE|nr:hypothetical protein GLIP_3210 [Aliiglaciecola lipolytica E3]